MKKLLLSFIITGMVVCSLVNTGQATDINSTSPLVRGTTNNETLNNYRSFELGEAILLLMPDKNIETEPMNWDYRSEAPIVWMTDGYKTELNGYGKEVSFREGLMRINVQGIESRILRKKKEELAWTVRYFTSNNPKFGFESIWLYPGDSDGQCFGHLYDNCDFELQQSLKDVNINMKKICEEKYTGDFKLVGYELSQPDKRNIFAELLYSGGSGGSSTTLEIFFSKKEKDLCNDDEDNSVVTSSKAVVNNNVTNNKRAKETPKESDLGICENVSVLAKSIMGARQSGVSISKVMQLANGSALLESLIIAAYSKPSFSTEQYKEEVIREFSDDAYLSCIKTLRN